MELPFISLDRILMFPRTIHPLVYFPNHNLLELIKLDDRERDGDPIRTTPNHKNGNPFLTFVHYDYKIRLIKIPRQKHEDLNIKYLSDIRYVTDNRVSHIN